METFVEPTPAEVQNALLQFMGQNIGELKQLDNSLISKNNTLQGLTLRPKAVLDSVANTLGPVQPVVTIPVQTAHVEPQQLVPQPQPAVLTVPVPVDNQDQLEFNFNTSPLSERIFDELTDLRKKLSILDSKLDELIEANKKKAKSRL